MPWLYFIAAVRQHARLEAADLLRGIAGPATALSSLFSDNPGEQQLRLRVLERVVHGPGAPLTTHAAPPRPLLVDPAGRPLSA